ncbi:DUF177 domain-containing protein [Aureimonas mangrovi]|uniref:DUF177 domain-containing protein n=1 Tax=Aureimonas mangrovi TaxID=2758041 RepID=UPI00163DDC2B|nr:DUF177 domain-containing protein [Aureimonas mangrovi]
MSAERRAQKPVLDCDVVVSRLPRSGLEVTYEANARERSALADLLSVLDVESVTARVTVSPWRRDGVSVRGRLTAEVTQASVVSLEPVEQAIDEEVDLVFLPEGSRLARPRQAADGELVVDPEGDDVPETFTGDRIPLGGAFAEIVALALDPYPRGGGESFEPAPDDAADAEPERPVSPFAALSRLKPGEK